MSITQDSSLLVGVFYDREHAERAFRELQQEGFGNSQLSMALLDEDEAPVVPPMRSQPTQARAGAAIGVVAGGILGIPAGVLATIWLSILGPLLLLGLVIGLTAATGIGLGGMLGALIGWTIRPEERRPLVGRPPLSRGIVTVRALGRYDQAAAILRRHAGCDSDPATAEKPR